MTDWWENYPWRLIQTNLRQIDMQDIRAEQVVRDLQDFKATVLMINAAGIIASYPTQIPYHFQSPYLTGDSLLEIISACHAAGIRVIARTDFSKVRRPVYSQYPDWAYLSAAGEVVDYNGDVHVCVNSWYQQQGILHILDELFTTHPFDGVFFNMGGYITHDYSGNYHGPCCCANCQRRFMEMYAQPLPHKSPLPLGEGQGEGELPPSTKNSENAQEQGGSARHREGEKDLPSGETEFLASPAGGGVGDAQHRRGEGIVLPYPTAEALYADFKRRTLHQQEETIYTFLAERYPHLCIANHTRFNRGFIRQEANTALDRPLPLWQYSAADNTKWAVGSHPLMVSSNTTVDFIDFPYRHTAVSPHEQALRLAQSLAEGGALDYYLIGRLDNHADRSGFAPVREMFHYHAAHQAEYTGLRSLAQVALLKPPGEQDEYRGWFRALTEAHIPFDVLTVEAALQRSWEPYRGLVLPGVEALGDPLAQALDAYVQAGGTLVATGRAGWRDETGTLRPTPALQCLGIDGVLAEQPDLRSPYFLVEDKTLFPRLAQTDLVYLDGLYITAQYASAAQLLLRFIPPHPFGPPERCYYEQVTDLPGLVRHPYGLGTAVYLPWQPGSAVPPPRAA
jgi:hypothetical protein